jgi:hypothetical protein
MNHLFIDIAAGLGAIAVISSAIYWKLRAKFQKVEKDPRISIDLCGDEPSLTAAQLQNYNRIIQEQAAELMGVASPSLAELVAKPQEKTYSISGNAGLAWAMVFLSGSAVTARVADPEGNFSFVDLAPGVYRIVPNSPGHLFKPKVIEVEIVDSDITDLVFEDPSSRVDSRQAVPGFGRGPNASRVLNGTIVYDVQTSSNAKIPPTDSRKAGAPVACGTYPQNSRK